MFTPTRRIRVDVDGQGHVTDCWVEWRSHGEVLEAAQMRYGPFDTPGEVLEAALAMRQLTLFEDA